MKKTFVSCLLFPLFLSSCCIVASEQDKLQKDTGLERNPVIYSIDRNSFQKYLSWTDEKERTAEAILSVIGGKNNSLLDIGAGNGLLTKLLESNCNHITAVEPSAQLFEVLKSNCNSSKYTLLNAPFEQAGLKNKFDVILACHSLKFIPNAEKTIEQIKNLLGDSGVFVLIDHAEESEFLKFYNTYSHHIFKDSKLETVFIDYAPMLSKYFKVKTVIFTASLTIPTIEDALSILDFIYDVEWSSIQNESLMSIRQALTKKYGKGPVILSLKQCLYICKA